MKTVLIEQ